MDVKTLSAIIGHISSATTIDIYSHITGAMQRQAAQKIERGIGHSEAHEAHETLGDQLPTTARKPTVRPVQGQGAKARHRRDLRAERPPV